jgi:hypothetical protein
MEGNTINWLQKWAISQIGGDWEHEEGISLSMVDPGWMLSVDLVNYEKQFYKNIDRKWEYLEFIL